MNYTLEDYQQGRCTLDQIGKDIPPIKPVRIRPPSTTPEEFIGEWMEVYQAIGGRKALEDFARENPIKFYDQLMRLLVSMEAPKQVMSLHIERGTMSEHELESLSTLELKRRLLAGNTIEGESQDIS